MTQDIRPLSISVLGMGYVGCVSAACLARDGHRVIGVDVSDVKLKAIGEGHSPIREPGLDELIHDAVRQGRITVTPDVAEAIAKTDLSLVCVGTPSNVHGGLDLGHVERVCRQIGEALAERPAGHVVVIRSTMLPGSMAKVVRPALESASGHADGGHFYTAMNPEFLREGTAIADYDHPPKVVVGTRHARADQLMRQIYGHLDAPFIVAPPEVAEMVKYTDNVWHAVKIAFGNEIGEICRHVGVDSHAVMDIFLQDTHLNISPYYLRPGFAFGGSCLPKDLRALTHFGRHSDLSLPLLQSVLPSNADRIDGLFRRVLDSGARRVGVYGLSFKRDTDDLRESPFVTLVEKLLGKGIQVRIYDENIQPEKLTGANKQYIDAHIPHLVNLLIDGFSAFDGFAEVVIIGHRSEGASAWVRSRNAQIRVMDLARLPGMLGSAGYEGVSW
jgi:GDP-mannose 6-dehydrogenase